MRDSKPYADGSSWQAPAGYGVSASEPAAGFYRCRLVGGGVIGGVRLVYGQPPDPVTGETLDRSFRWMAYFDGDLVDLDSVWPKCADSPITEVEYDALCARRAWARDYAPKSAHANPTKRYDPLSLDTPIPF